MIGLILVSVGILVMSLVVAFVSIRRDRKREQAETLLTLGDVLDTFELEPVLTQYPRMDVPKKYPAVRTRRSSFIA